MVERTPDKDVQRELQRTGAAEAPPSRPVRGRHKVWLAGYLLLLLALGVTYYLLRLHWFGFDDRFAPLLRRAVLGAMAVALVLALARAIDAFVIERACSPVSQYNFKRFALQSPITSLFGWGFILAREPYRIGDRIRIGEHTGDVIAVSYLDTTLWEVGGDYVSTDHPSGRLVKFPNAHVLSNPVLNYSWSLFPYVWNEITFHVGYDSDLAFVERTLRETVEEDMGAAMADRVQHFRELLLQTPVDHVQVLERPSVLFRVNPNTWIEATVRYLVDPKDAGPTKTRLMARLLERLNAEPDRTRFPKGDSR